jgi:hypothetical protein
VRGLLLVSLVSLPAHALSSATQEFISITKELEPAQCRTRQLRREIARAGIEQRQDDAKRLRAQFTGLDKDKKAVRPERRVAELQPRISDPEDLAAIGLRQRQAFYRCE